MATERMQAGAENVAAKPCTEAFASEMRSRSPTNDSTIGQVIINIDPGRDAPGDFAFAADPGGDRGRSVSPIQSLLMLIDNGRLSGRP